MDTLLLIPIALPLAIALLLLLTPDRARGLREFLAVLTCLAAAILNGWLLFQPGLQFRIAWLPMAPGINIPFELSGAPLGRAISLAGACFALFSVVYSLRYLYNHPRHKLYYSFLLLALAATSGAALSGNLIILLFFWELHGFVLYTMVMVSGDESIPSASKALLLAGLGDMGLLLGVILLWMVSGTFNLQELSSMRLSLENPLLLAAFALMLSGAFVKSGILPLHTWIPAISTHALPPVMGLFTALDKLIGIYLIARMVLDLFVLSPAVAFVLMAIGSIAILAGVLMAVVQHDYRRMLAFHSISQVGYMLVGLASGTLIGSVGALLHLFNIIVLKGNLFFCGGTVQRQTGRTHFEEMGGLAKSMPWTFASTLVVALGIAGVPPLNAFVSKWMVYQGILTSGVSAFPLFLGVAMFGSALTLASFIKLLYSMFWGERPLALARVREAPWLMRLPLLTLSLITILSGLFYRPVIDALIAPALPSGAAQTIGFWQPDLAAVLLVLSLLAGAVFYLLGRLGQAREVEVFVGGESINPAILRVPGTDFYGPLKEVSPLSKLYPLGESGVFDIYTYGMRGVRWASAIIYEYIDQALSDFYQEVIPASLALTGQILKLLNSRLVLTRLVLGLYVLAGAATLLVPVSDVIAYTRILACLGMIGWGLLAWVESDLIRLLIFSATSQLGLVLLALTLTPAIALSYILNGLLALGVLYLIIRSITAFQGTTRIEILNGLAGRIPGRFLLFLLAALWLSGLPPFGSFFSKYLLGVAAGEVSPFLTIIITATAILTLAYLLRPIRHFLRSAQQEAEYKPADEHKPVTTT